LLYAPVRAIFAAFFRLWFRLRITGAEHLPASGPAVITPNHKSFWDSFFIGAATRRHLRFMGKSELFEGWKGPLLVRLGAFPVRRGESDQDALDTARAILDQGGLLSLFPEGTRVRDPDSLGEPRRGAARLAIEAGAPMVPAAITGTDRLWLGPIPRPRRVQVAFGAPISVKELAATPEAAGRLVESELWPEVESQFRDLLSHPGVIAAGLAALGLGGAALARSRTQRKPAWQRMKPRLPSGRRSRMKPRLPSGQRSRMRPRLRPGRRRRRAPWRRG
jgi:1-acyl-sn-glycerol-3-phosphate acyltransferase